MKKLLSLLFFCGLAQAAISVYTTQAVGNLSTGVTSLTIGSAIAVRAGDVIFIALRIHQTCGTGNTIVDDNANSYTQLDFGGAHGIQESGDCLYAFYAKNAPLNNAMFVTANFSPAGDYPALMVASLSGLDTTTPLDVGNCANASNHSASTTTITTSAYTTHINNEIIIGFGQFGATNNTFTLNSGFTNLGGDSNHMLSSQYKIVSSTQTGQTITLQSDLMVSASIAAASFADSAVNCGGSTNHTFSSVPIVIGP